MSSKTYLRGALPATPADHPAQQPDTGTTTNTGTTTQAGRTVTGTTTTTATTGGTATCNTTN